jgi:glutaconate CoA-transferase subunit B
MNERYHAADLMAITMAKQFRPGERVFFGVNSPLPMVAVHFARHYYRLPFTEINIAGGIDPYAAVLPRSSVYGDLINGSASIFDNMDFYDLVSRGGVDVTFLGMGQIDQHARVNTTVIGKFGQPKVRLPGGGGAPVIMPRAKRVLVWRAAHNRRTFVKEVDFVTATGNIDRVITPLCVFRKEDGRLVLDSVHPQVTLDHLQSQTGFDLGVQGSVPVTPEPTSAELAALEELDPGGIRRLEF